MNKWDFTKEINDLETATTLINEVVSGLQDAQGQCDNSGDIASLESDICYLSLACELIGKTLPPYIRRGEDLD